MELREIYTRLEEIDEALVELYIERLRQNAEIAEYKRKHALSIPNAEFEARKIEAVRRETGDRFQQEALEELYKQILAVSRRYQYLIQARHGIQTDTGFRVVDMLPEPRCVVYQGVEGAYGNMAAVSYFKDCGSVSFYHVSDFEAALIEVEEGRADYAVLPIENSTAGSVVDTYDLLMHHAVNLVGECFLPIRHALLALPGVRLEEIRRVYSHPQGLRQCAEFFARHPQLKPCACSNTAVAAKKIREEQDRSQAAIASAYAGKLYGLEAVAEDVSIQKENTTRFIVAGPEKIYRYDAKKVSLILETAHESGALYNILGNFLFNHINMVRLESRPIPDVSWEYRFFIDIEGNLNQPGVINAVNSISKQARGLRILGCY